MKRVRLCIALSAASAMLAPAASMAVSRVDVAGIADMDGDGLDDVLIRTSDNGGDQGRIAAVSGGSRTWTRAWQDYAWPLRSVDGDADGGADVLLWDHGANWSGNPTGLSARSVTLASGADGSDIWTLPAWMDDITGVPGSSRFLFVDALDDPSSPGDLLAGVQWQALRPEPIKGGVQISTHHLSICRISARTGLRASTCIERDTQDTFFMHALFEDLDGRPAFLLSVWERFGQRLVMYRLDGTPVWDRLAPREYYLNGLRPMPGARPLVLVGPSCGAQVCGNDYRMLDGRTGRELWNARTTMRPTGEFDGDGAPDVSVLESEQGQPFTMRIRSGTTDAVLLEQRRPDLAHPSAGWHDLNGDSFADIIATASIAGTASVVGIDGRTLGERWRRPGQFNGQPLRADASGNGTDDFYSVEGDSIVLREADGLAVLWSLPYTGGTMLAGNFAADARVEILVSTAGRITAYGPAGPLWSYAA